MVDTAETQRRISTRVLSGHSAGASGATLYAQRYAGIQLFRIRSVSGSDAPLRTSRTASPARQRRGAASMEYVRSDDYTRETRGPAARRFPSDARIDYATDRSRTSRAPSANSSITFLVKARMSSDWRLVTNPWSATTS